MLKSKDLKSLVEKIKFEMNSTSFDTPYPQALLIHIIEVLENIYVTEFNIRKKAGTMRWKGKSLKQRKREMKRVRSFLFRKKYGKNK